MKLRADDVKWVHVEASSKCNAWCPACPRNKHGFGLKENLIEQDLHPNQFEKLILGLQLLDGIQFCGNFGDPIASAYIVDLIRLSKKYAKKIQIHTNGSLRNTAWWQDLAKELSDIEHDVWFGIDGLKGVHEIYRQATDFDKIIENAKAFIEAGGCATWQFIPYKHNEHQVLSCLKLSQQLGFKRFHLAKLYRNKVKARHYKTGEEFDLLPSTKLQSLTNINRPRQTVELKNCMHLSMPSVYISAEGTVSRCCYLEHAESFASIEQMLNEVDTDLSEITCIQNCG